jgi:GntR family transcriptional regulator
MGRFPKEQAVATSAAVAGNRGLRILYTCGIQYAVPDPTISVVLDSPVPVYRQVVDQVRVHLAGGALRAGDELPSVRSLAAQLGVHFNTIADAYRELAAEGWIDLAHGKRAVVVERDAAGAMSHAEAEPLRLRLRALLAEMRSKGVSVRSIEREVAAMLGAKPGPPGKRS